MHFFLCGILLIVVLSIPTMSYKTGAPNTACTGMKPNHKNYKPQMSDMPYAISFPKMGIIGGQTIPLTLKGYMGQPFKGFLIKGVNSENRDEIVGTFDVSISNGLAKTLECIPGKENAVTHVNENDKLQVVIDWMAPSDFSGKVEFLYSVVKKVDTFWVQASSDTVEVHAIDVPTSTMNVPTTITTIETTTIKPTPSGGSLALKMSIMWTVMSLILSITNS